MKSINSADQSAAQYTRAAILRNDHQDEEIEAVFGFTRRS